MMSRPSIPNPFQTLLMVVCFIQSLPLIRGDTGSTVLERTVSDKTAVAWGICMLVGSGMVLIGERWKRPHYMGALFERTGLLLFGAGALIYSGVIVFAAEVLDDVRYVASLHAAIGVAALMRAWQVDKDMRRIRKIQEEISE